MENYFTLTSFIEDFYDATCRQFKFTGSTENELLEWQKKSRSKLSEIIGLDLLQDYFSSQDFGDPYPLPDYDRNTYRNDVFTREKLYLRIERDIVVPLYLFMPNDLEENEKRPVILAPHGHGGCGKYATAGIKGKYKQVDESIEYHDYNYGEHFASLGCIVLCPDAAGFGERREAYLQNDSSVLAASCQMLSHILNPLGLSMQGVFTHDLMRLTNYALSLPNADPERLYCIGLSGGGLQTLIFTALEPRIKKAIISGYFYGVKDALLRQPLNCSCNFSYKLWSNFDMGDIACMIYPRTFLIETGDADNLNGKSGLSNVKSQIDIARSAYALGGFSDRVVHHIYPGPHKWYGIDADKFLLS